MKYRSFCKFLLILGCFLFIGMAHAQDQIPASSPIGRWITIDENNTKRGIVEITQNGDELTGRIVKVFPQPDERSQICTKCEGDRKNQPVLGMVILWDTKKDDDTWNGSILDPENGSVYDCVLTMLGPDKMRVRGFLGIQFLGRTQIWVRATDDNS